MPGKVFISCGQATDEESRTAADVRDWLRNQGFEPYVAIQSQSIQDINSGIIGSLKAADYYIFIDFKREHIATVAAGGSCFRGSLFSHQELAIAYVFGIENCVFLRHQDVKLEGMGQYILTNAALFSDAKNVLPILQTQISQRGWSPAYSRHLCVENVRWGPKPIDYHDHTGRRLQRVLFADIHNKRENAGAMGVVLRLVRVQDDVGKQYDPVDRSNLKWAGHPAYSCTIRPKDYETVSLLALNLDDPFSVYLHSELDVVPRKRAFHATGGCFWLHYEAFVQGFPILKFVIRLIMRGNVDSSLAELAKA